MSATRQRRQQARTSLTHALSSAEAVAFYLDRAKVHEGAARESLERCADAARRNMEAALERVASDVRRLSGAS